MMRRRAAFTLFELILATATAAVMALALYSALSVAMKARASAARAVGLDREAALLADLIVRDLEATLPIPPAPAQATPAAQPPAATAVVPVFPGPFVGEPHAVSFHAFAPATGEGSADLPQRVELELIRERDSGVLVRRVQANLLAPREEELDEEVLCRGVTSFGLRYYDGQAWADAWDSSASGSATENYLPTAVEITLVLDRPSGDDRSPQRVSVVRFVAMPFGSGVPS